MASLSYLDADSWRYENSGTADDLLTSGTTLTNLPVTKSKTGTAFYQTSRAKCFDIPATPEIWLKFDVYNTDEEYDWYAQNGGVAERCGISSYWVELDFSANGSFVREDDFPLLSDTLQTIILHMVSGSSAGVVEAWVDGDFIYRYTGDVNHGQDFADIYLKSDGSGTFFSNVVIANNTTGLGEDAPAIPTPKIIIKPVIFATYIPLPPPDKAVADTCRTVQKTEKIIGDTSRTVNSSISVTKAVAHTLRKVYFAEKISADTYRAVTYTELARADTFRQVIKTEKIIVDLLRRLREITCADTYRKVNRKERAIARTVIRLPHVLNYVLQSRLQTFKAASTGRRLADNNSSSLVNTFKDYGVTAINITLSEKTLSDDFRFEIASRSMDINETVQGWLLDYPFNFLVEETTQTDLVQSVKGRYSVDDLLYTWFLLSLDTVIISDEKIDIVPSATEIITRIAHYFGLTPDVRIDNFTPSNFRNGSMMTYADVLTNVFGWTSRLPQRQINVFIRGGILYCIQRGKETAVFDITDLPHSRPTVGKKFNRVLCYNPNITDTDSNDDDDTKLFSGTIGYTDSHFSLNYTYQNGLLISENSISQTGDALSADGIPYYYGGKTDKTAAIARSYTIYSYTSYEGEYYLQTKTAKNSTLQNSSDGITKIEINTTTNYHYKTLGTDIYLFSEYEMTQTTEYNYNDDSVSNWEKDSEEEHTKETRHIPIGNGWYAQTVFVDGEQQGSNLSQGAPGNRVSPYTVKQAQRNFSQVEFAPQDPIKDGNELSAIVDDSFPVKETDIKNVLNDALRWLHRKIVETVNVDLIAKVYNGVPSIQHIVDFTERIRLDGAEYFLVSNKITFTPRKLIQKLQLIRWY